MKIRKRLIIIFIVVLLIVILWVIGIIPKMIGKYTTINYVKNNYKEMNLKYNNIEFVSVLGSYLVSFYDEENNIYNFKLYSRYLPISIAYDPIKQW